MGKELKNQPAHNAKISASHHFFGNRILNFSRMDLTDVATIIKPANTKKLYVARGVKNV